MLSPTQQPTANIMGMSSIPPSRSKADSLALDRTSSRSTVSTSKQHQTSMKAKTSKVASSTATTAATSNSTSGNTPNTATSSNNKKRGWDDIESIFDQKKKQQLQEREKQDLDEQQKQQQRQQRRSKMTKSSRPPSTATTDTGRTKTSEWVNDGLGGIYNHEGYTGRTSEDGMKIFKAHVISKNIQNAGQTKDCPFDCNCCFI